MISRKFKSFLTQGKFKKNKDSNSTLLSFKCNKSCHMKERLPSFKAENQLQQTKQIQQQEEGLSGNLGWCNSSSSD